MVEPPETAMDTCGGTSALREGAAGCPLYDDWLQFTRVAHGGSVRGDARGCRAAYRGGWRPVVCLGGLGFRPVAEVKEVPAEEESRVCRGGFWYWYARRCRSANRCAYPPALRVGYLGFRPVAEAVEPAGRDTSSWTGFPFGRWMAVMHRLLLGKTPDPADVQAIEEWRIRKILVTIQIRVEVPEEEP